MAVQYSDIVNALATIFEDDIVSQFNRAVVLSQLLPFRPSIGKNINWDPEFAGTSYAGATAEGADVSNYSDDTIVPASLSFTSYTDAFSITGFALSAAQAARNPSELANLFGEKLERSITRLTKQFNADLYNGSPAASPPQMTGLLYSSGGGILSTGSYAGIDRGTYPTWAGNVSANGGVLRELTIGEMRDMRVSIYNASGEKPDLIITTPTLQEKYGSLLGPARRYTQDVYLRGGKIALDGGYHALDFDGIPVVADVACPANKMLFLNTKHTFIRQMPRAEMPMALASATVRLHGTPEEQYGMSSTPMTADLQLLSVTGDSVKFQLVMYPQIQVRRPNACGVLSDLSEAAAY